MAKSRQLRQRKFSTKKRADFIAGILKNNQAKKGIKDIRVVKLKKNERTTPKQKFGIAFKKR